MKLYCSNCGMLLQHIRKALPKLGIIVDLVSYHECLEIPMPFCPSSSPATTKFKPIEGKEKFIQSLNELAIPNKPINKFEPVKGKRPRMIGTDNLRDRRFDQESKENSSAPPNIIGQIKTQGNSIPLHSFKDDSDSEMDE